jgi:LysM repeat protein
MNRKDTIIIAVLVNAALLIALFVTAIKRDSGAKVEEEKIAATFQPIAIPEMEKKEIKAAQGDEIDLVLKEFSEKKAEVVVNPEESQKIDFVKELEAITKSVSELPQETMHPSDDFIKVTVKKGDVLEKIARANQTSVDEIMRVNQLKNSMLQIGQTLKIPRKAGAATVERAVVSGGGGEEFYTVKQGDNPWAIAVKNHLKVDELLKLNNLTEEKARHLKPGDKLRIRK